MEQNASQSFDINNIQKYSYLYIIVYADDWEGYVLPSCIDHIQIAGHARYDSSNAAYFCRGAIFVNQTNGACYQKLLKMNGQSAIEVRIYVAYLA